MEAPSSAPAHLPPGLSPRARALTPAWAVPPDRCPGCLLKRDACLCAALPTLPTRTRVVILRHFKEVKRPSNSGRLAALALPNCEVLDYGAPDGPPIAPSLGDSPGILLFPDGPPAPLPPPGAEPPPRLVILDATWPQARKMLGRVPALARMPRLSLDPAVAPPAARRLRQPRRPQDLSTIEAIAHALALLEGNDTVARALLALFERFVDASGPRRADIAFGRNAPARP
ncbi:MAG: DTW domain-containing protein [Planctomycetes bacterium]|nr:DTW domain-containing protein [Planctomycetota bacterium]